MLSGLLRSFSNTNDYSLLDLAFMYREIYAKIFIVYVQLSSRDQQSERGLKLLKKLSFGKTKERLPQTKQEVEQWYLREIAHLLNSYYYIYSWRDGDKLLRIAEYAYEDITKKIWYNQNHYYAKKDPLYITKYKIEVGDEIYYSNSRVNSGIIRKGPKVKKRRKRISRKKKAK